MKTHHEDQPMFKDPWSWLEARDWHNPQKAHHEIEDWLQKGNEVTSSLLRPIVECSDIELPALSQRSHETSTHYKWFVAASPTWDWQIWLHQFKDSNQRRFGYAVTPHNHRYWFTAVMLHGAYRNARYQVGEVPNIVAEDLVAAGSVYTLSPAVVHAISEVKAGTITIVIRGRAVTPFSTEYLADGTQIHHAPMKAQLKATRDQLRSLLD